MSSMVSFVAEVEEAIASKDPTRRVETLRRLGFKPEGIARQAEFVSSRWVDHAVFSKLSTD